MNMNKLKKDSSGIATILLLIIIVVVVAGAGVAAYVVLSNNGGSNEEAPKEMPIAQGLAPGTVLKYDIYNGTKTTQAEFHYVGQNTTSYFVKNVVVISPLISEEEYELVSKGAPAGAKYIGKEDRTTFEGKLNLQIWEYSETINGKKYTFKEYVNPANGLTYYREMRADGVMPVTFTLKYYDLKTQISYTPSSSLGKAYEYTGYVSGVKHTAKLTVIADCTGGKYGIEMSGNVTHLYLSNYPQGVPINAVKDMEGTLPGTIDGDVYVDKLLYGLTNGEMEFYCHATTHIVYGFIVDLDDGPYIIFDLTKKP